MRELRRTVPCLLAVAGFAALTAVPDLGPRWVHLLAAVLFVGCAARWAGALGGFAAAIAALLALVRPWEPTLAPLPEPTGEPFLLATMLLVVGAGSAIGRLERTLGVQTEVSHKAQYDPLTNLLNRTAFDAQVQRALAEARQKKLKVALLFVDLDRFKVVNDTYGHELGDAVLRKVADLLREHVRDADLICRLGGDEFTVALRNLREGDSARAVGEKLLGLLNATHEVMGRQIEVGASIGIAVFPDDGEDVPTLLKNADHAMYGIKEAGRNGVGISTRATQVRNDRRIEVERQLRAALEEDEFELHFQPKVDLRTGDPVGMELLLRWRNPTLGSVSPAEFVPMAEETGLILPLGRWILRQACFRLAQWDAQGLPPVVLAVNVSTLQFRQPDFVRAVEDALHDSGIRPDRLELEITETMLMKDVGASMKTLKRLDALGVRIALDDFGTGYSSLAYLQHLPIHTLKIDRSFVSDLVLRPGAEPAGAAPIVDSIVTLGRKLGLVVVAEGVETQDQARWLAEIGCHQAQGFLFCRPLPETRIDRVLERVRHVPRKVDTEGDALLMTGG